MPFLPQYSNGFSKPISFQGYGDSVFVADSLCPELVKILVCEVENGNVVLDVEHWSKTECKYTIVMRDPLSYDRYLEQGILPDTLEHIIRTDCHYTTGDGLCTKEYPPQIILGPFQPGWSPRKMTWMEWMRVCGCWFLLGAFGLIVGILLVFTTLWQMYN